MKKYTYLLKLNLKQANIDLSKIDPALIYKTEGDYTYVAYSCNAPLNTQSKLESYDLCSDADYPLYCGNPFAENRFHDYKSKAYKSKETSIEDVLKYLGIDAAQIPYVAEDILDQIVHERKNTYNYYPGGGTLRSSFITDSFITFLRKLEMVRINGLDCTNKPEIEGEHLEMECLLSVDPISSTGRSLQNRNLDIKSCVRYCLQIIGPVCRLLSMDNLDFPLQAANDNAAPYYTNCIKRLKENFVNLITSSNPEIKARYYLYFLNNSYLDSCSLFDFLQGLCDFLHNLTTDNPNQNVQSLKLSLRLDEVHDLKCILVREHLIQECNDDEFEFYFIGGYCKPTKPIYWLNRKSLLVVLLINLNCNNWRHVAQIFVQQEEDGSLKKLSSNGLAVAANRYRNGSFKKEEDFIKSIINEMRQVDIIE